MIAISKLSNSIKNDILVSVLESCGTHIIAVASNPIKEKNTISFLSCKDFLPLGGLVYDTQSDNYVISCADYLHVGTIPISFIATSKSCPNWKVNVPIPDKVIKRYLSSGQKKEIKKFFAKFDESFLQFYIQMLNPNI